jgi:hypothetical protein
MQRLIKGFAVGILCLQWSLPVSAQDEVFAVTCDPVIKNPDPLTNTSPTRLDAEGSFQLTCICPSPRLVTGGFIKLSIVSGESTTRNGLARIKLPDNDDFKEEINGIPYRETTTYDVNVSTLNGEILQGGDYSVAVKFELSSRPQCRFGGG